MTAGHPISKTVPSIPTYLSHSYRKEDREINLEFHKLAWEAGFSFTVDPQGWPLSTTRLEMMMRHAACFMAIVPRREEVGEYRCSPYAVYENGLATRASKPRLILLERNVARRHFESSPNIVVFDRSHLSRSRNEITDKLEELATASRPNVNIGNRALGSVGLLLPSTPHYAAAEPTIKALVHEAGYAPIDLHLTDADSASAAQVMDSVDFVVLDIGSTGPESKLIPFIQGRFIPSIKLIRRTNGRSSSAQIPPLMRDRALATAEKRGEVALTWSNVDELAGKLKNQLKDLSVVRMEFGSMSEGESYLLSLGRTRGRVFLSNASPDNHLAKDVVERLKAYKIEVFHYVYNNPIEKGTDWKLRLPMEIEASSIFIPLVSKAFWQSQMCRDELKIADRRIGAGLKVVPCYLEENSGPEIEVQGMSLWPMTHEDRVEAIVELVDRELVDDRRKAGVA